MLSSFLEIKLFGDWGWSCVVDELVWFRKSSGANKLVYHKKIVEKKLAYHKEIVEW